MYLWIFFCHVPFIMQIMKFEMQINRDMLEILKREE